MNRRGFLLGAAAATVVSPAVTTQPLSFGGVPIVPDPMLDPQAVYEFARQTAQVFYFANKDFFAFDGQSVRKIG